MPDEDSDNKSTVKPQVSQTFNADKVNAKFKLIEDNVNKQVGKKGFNPFFWLRDNKVEVLHERFLKGDKTSALYTQIMSLPAGPPSLDLAPDMTEAEAVKRQSALADEASKKAYGLRLPESQSPTKV